MAGDRTLRTRLTVLYGLSFLACGVVVLVLAALPALTFSSTHQAGTARDTSSSNLPQVLAYSAGVLAVLAVLSVGLGRYVAVRALRPLLVIGTAARAASASNLRQRVSLDGSYQEFSDLGAALDELFGRLDTAFEAQRSFVANAAHELRTPLTAERTLLQVTLADPAASVETLRAACAQLLDLGAQQEQLIEALLTLAAGENGLEDRASFDLAVVARKVVDDRLPLASGGGIRVEARLAPAFMTGDARLVASLVTNLVDNALRYNATGGWIEVVTGEAAGTGTDAGTATIAIGNSGPPVPPDQIERLFQPFQRLGGRGERYGDGHGPGGHGLGLAIVRTIATAHGATLTARANAGGGLTVVVAFSRPVSARVP
jgi:signal transduction histidine kinase